MCEDEATMNSLPVSTTTPSSQVSLTMESPKRRCSARLLSQSVHQTLEQLQKDEHDLKVTQLLKKSETYYKRQKVCETFITFSILVSFSGK
jgi:hypothetical protein